MSDTARRSLLASLRGSAFFVLAALAEADSPVSLLQLARDSGYNRGTVSAAIRRLETLGLASQGEAPRGWALTGKARALFQSLAVGNTGMDPMREKPAAAMPDKPAEAPVGKNLALPVLEKPAISVGKNSPMSVLEIPADAPLPENPAVSVGKNSPLPVLKIPADATLLENPAVSVGKNSPISVLEKPAVPVEKNSPTPVLEKPAAPVGKNSPLPVLEKPAVSVGKNSPTPVLVGKNSPVPVPEKPAAPVGKFSPIEHDWGKTGQPVVNHAVKNYLSFFIKHKNKKIGLICNNNKNNLPGRVEVIAALRAAGLRQDRRTQKLLDPPPLTPGYIRAQPAALEQKDLESRPGLPVATLENRPAGEPSVLAAAFDAMVQAGLPEHISARILRSSPQVTPALVQECVDELKESYCERDAGKLFMKLDRKLHSCR